MVRAFKLIACPRRNILLRLLPPIVLTYFVLLPLQFNALQGADATLAARSVFTLAQVFLGIGALWGQFAYFSPILKKENRELLRGLQHPDGICFSALFLEHQIFTIPAYLVYFILLPEHRPMIGLLILQALCLGLGHLALSTAFYSSVAGMIVLLIYVVAPAMLDARLAPVLIQKNALWNEIVPIYFLIRLIIIGAELIAIKLMNKRI